MQITVTQDHIDSGTPGNACECPIALAIREHGYDCPEVTSNSVSLVHGLIAPLPDIAIQFIELLDTGLPVVPISFELPEPVAGMQDLTD